MQPSSVVVLALGLCLVAMAAYGAEAGQVAGADELPAIKELPDPFLLKDGSRVKTKEDWARRRAELKELIQDYEYGHMPPPPGNVTGKELSSKRNEPLNATEKQVLLTMGPEGKVFTHLELTIPAGAGPFAVIVTGDLSWGKVKEPVAAAVVKRGYVLAEFNRVEIAPDSKDRTTGVHVAYPDYDWGSLAAWAWGYHRVVDYLVGLDYVDRSRIAITGHSRGGKATLLAGAMDERIALTAPNNSGCGGAGCYRYQAEKSEDIAAIVKSFPFWFHPRFGQFIGRTDRLPFDQHSVKALIAPRALLTTEALGDLWANPKGAQQTHVAAKEAFDFLGAGQKIGIRFRQGKHEHNAEDWAALLDFADKQLYGKTVEGKFDEPAFPDAEKGFSWSAPRGGV